LHPFLFDKFFNLHSRKKKFFFPIHQSLDNQVMSTHLDQPINRHSTTYLSIIRKEIDWFSLFNQWKTTSVRLLLFVICHSLVHSFHSYSMSGSSTERSNFRGNRPLSSNPPHSICVTDRKVVSFTHLWTIDHFQSYLGLLFLFNFFLLLFDSK
jgi:hypothetical protein